MLMTWTSRLLILFALPTLALPGLSACPAPPQSDAFEKVIDVGSARLFLSCTGKPAKEGPTVILEAGMNESSATWRGLPAKIADFTRVCAYDRAGLGKSNTATPGARTSLQVATELHALLKKAGITGPLLIVGHSLGGVHARMYASRYAIDVAGMVLVDSVHEDEIARWLAMVPAEARRELEAEGAMRVMGDEAVDVEASFAQLRAAKWRTRIPLIVLSRGRKSFTAADYPPRLRSLAPRGEALRIEMQKDLARRSTRGRHRFAEKSGHMIHHDEPDVVLEAIREVMEAARGGGVKRQ